MEQRSRNGLAAAWLGGALACGRVEALDPALAVPLDPAQVEFQASNPALVEQRRMEVLDAFGGYHLDGDPSNSGSRALDARRGGIERSRACV